MNSFAKKSFSAACAVVMLSTFTVNAYAGSIPQGKEPIRVTQMKSGPRNISGLTLFNAVNAETFTAAQGVISSFYQIILGRTPKQQEIDAYANDLASGTTVAQILSAFFNSDEFTNKNTSDEEYVKILYRAVLGREGKSNEVDFYVEALQSSARNDVLINFTGSSEFQNRYSALGLTPGSLSGDTSAANTVQESQASSSAHNIEGLQGYVKRLYNLVLGRNAKDWEVEERTGELVSNISTAGQMASEFFNSPEFLGKNTTTAEYITILYQTMMGRTPKEREVNEYVNSIDNDKYTRNYILSCFVSSPEFANICAGYGVPVGSVYLSAYDLNPKIVQFVERQYTTVLGRSSVKESELRERTEQLAGGVGAAQMLLEFFNSPEFTGRKLSNEEYVKVLYRAVLGREAKDKEVKEYVDMLSRGASRNYLYSCFVNSPEFANLASNYGISVGTVDIYDSVPPKDANDNSDSGKKEEDKQTPWDNENLTVRYNGKNVTDTVENILVKTVYAEVGGFRNAEVYKAQAVAAYTYIRYHNSRGNIPSLPLTTPPSNANSEVLSAVRSVKGQSLTYNGSLAQTTYYAMSNGKTNSSADIWKNNVAYLVSVDSKYDVNATNYKVTKNYTLDEFYKIMDKIYGGRSMYNTSGDPSSWIKLTKNSAGYVTAINLCGRTPSTEYFYQTMFGLRSAAFDVSYNSSNKTFTFTTYGYGHGVGMSQWGAYYYAVNEGWGYEQILAHYFPGTKLTKS